MAMPAARGVPPRWAQDLYYLHAGRVARQFIIHFNITDQVIELEREAADASMTPPRKYRMGAMIGDPAAFRSYLHWFLRQEWGMGCQAIYSYSLAGGLIADEDQEQRNGAPLRREMRGPGWARLFDTVRASERPKAGENGQPLEGSEVADVPEEPAEVFKVLGHLLRQRHYAGAPSTSPAMPAGVAQAPERPVAVIVDYAEKLMPVGVADGRSMVEQLMAVEVAQRWAIDPLIRATNNVVILLTSNLGQLAANLYAAGSGCRTIRVPLPDEFERAAYLRYLIAQRTQPGRVGLLPLKEADFGADPERQLESLTTLTQGMRLADIDNLNRHLKMKFAASQSPDGLRSPALMSQGDVQEEKEQVIQSQSEQLLEVVPRRRGFDDIGGLDRLKLYLRTRARLMQGRVRSPLVPSGLLLAGPPGTGKTIIAEALAKESGFNLVKMRNIQDRWVGSSERNLDMVINLLKDLYPVVVFIDEIDQAVGRRDTGMSGDSGVSGRMFARILEEMSNAANRGRILWIAATNRTDLLDDALLRRFDRVIPLLIPDEAESRLIFATMPRTINAQSGAQNGEAQVRYALSLALREGIPAREQDTSGFAEAARRAVGQGLTGAGIEVVVRRAFEIAVEEALGPALRANFDPEAGPPLGGGFGQPEQLVIEGRHLLAALDDYKPNQDRAVYDLQSLLALQACNFVSVLPPLPNRPPFLDLALRDPAGAPMRDGAGNPRLDGKRLTEMIRKVREELGMVVVRS